MCERSARQNNRPRQGGVATGVRPRHGSRRFSGMPNDEFAPNLTKLGRNYQILTELDREGVVADISRATPRSQSRRDHHCFRRWRQRRAALPHLASDARLLTAMRHPNIIPVIEGIWLDGQTFAVVRARVRGSRLDQLIGKTGPIPIGRVATTIQTVHDAIAWARNNGVVNRRVALSSVMFQQGNERVFLTLELAAFVRGAIPDECDDARTIGVLCIGHDVGADHPRRRTGARGQHSAASRHRGLTIRHRRQTVSRGQREADRRVALERVALSGRSRTRPPPSR